MYLLVLKRMWPYIAGLLVIVALYWAIDDRGYRSGLAEGFKRQEAALVEQRTELTKECNNARLATQQANDELQQKYSDIAGKLAASKQLHPDKCIRVKTSVAKYSTSGKQRTRPGGISSDWIRELAAECETYRSEVITLDNFGKKYCQ